MFVTFIEYGNGLMRTIPEGGVVQIVRDIEDQKFAYIQIEGSNSRTRAYSSSVITHNHIVFGADVAKFLNNCLEGLEDE